MLNRLSSGGLLCEQHLWHDNNQSCLLLADELVHNRQLCGKLWLVLSWLLPPSG